MGGVLPSSNPLRGGCGLESMSRQNRSGDVLNVMVSDKVSSVQFCQSASVLLRYVLAKKYYGLGAKTYGCPYSDILLQNANVCLLFPYVAYVVEYWI